MRKYIFGIALLLLAGTSALAQEENTITTRFGALTISDAGTLLFKGNPFDPPFKPENGLGLSERYQIGATDVVFVTEDGWDCLPGHLLLCHRQKVRRQNHSRFWYLQRPDQDKTHGRLHFSFHAGLPGAL